MSEDYIILEVIARSTYFTAIFLLYLTMQLWKKLQNNIERELDPGKIIILISVKCVIHSRAMDPFKYSYLTNIIGGIEIQQKNTYFTFGGDFCTISFENELLKYSNKWKKVSHPLKIFDLS